MPAPNTYQEIFTNFNRPFEEGLSQTLAGGVQYVGGLLPYILVPAVIMVFVLTAIGAMSQERLKSYAGRVFVVMWLITGGAYINQFSGLIINDIPNEIARTFTGSPTVVGARQFDVLNDKAGLYTAGVLKQATGIMQVPNALSARIGRFAFQIALNIIYIFWLVSSLVTLLGVAMGVFAIPMFIYETTRHMFMGWVGMIVGCILFKVATAIVLNIMYSGMVFKLNSVIAQSATLPLEQQVDQIFEIGAFFSGCAMLMLMVPVVTSFAGGHGVSSAINRMTVSGTGGMMQAGNNLNKAAMALKDVAGKLGRQ